MIEKLPLESLAPVVIDEASEEIDWQKVMEGCPRMPELPASRKLDALDRRINLWCSCGGRCARCGAFFSVRSLVPMWMDKEKLRLAAVCAKCAKPVTRGTTP